MCRSIYANVYRNIRYVRCIKYKVKWYVKTKRRLYVRFDKIGSTKKDGRIF